MYRIPFNRAHLAGKELAYIKEAIERGHIAGDGVFSARCSELLEGHLGATKVLLTPSCTAALEMAALLLDLQPGDEFIVPSYAFVTTVNSFVLRGARPVFVDIRADTLNLDESKIEERITPRTRAIVPLHYAGVGCEMDTVLAIAQRHKISIVEDAAQGVDSTYRGRFLGTMGRFGTYSFHETKNFTCGEGGALVVNRFEDIERAEIVRQKGTNRNQFHRGVVDKYTWQDLGSSFTISEILAAFLYAQLENMEKISNRRKEIFEQYETAFSTLQSAGKVQIPSIPDHCKPSHHMFYLLFENENIRNRVMDGLNRKGILAVFHYVPLHTSPYGRQFGFREGDLPVTERLSRCLLRMPFYNDLTAANIEEIARLAGSFL